MWPFLREKVLTVASPSIMAATISPLLQSFCERMTTKSPSHMAASIIDSPTTLSMNRSPEPTRDSGRGKVSSISCSAVIGPPAAMRPTSGMYFVLSTGATLSASPGSNTSSARPRVGSRRMKPFFSNSSSWYLTDAGDERPACVPISRMLGG